MTERYAALQGRYTTKEAAALAEVHPVTLRIWNNKGFIPGCGKRGGIHWFAKEPFDAWLKNGTRPDDEQGKAA